MTYKNTSTWSFSGGHLKMLIVLVLLTLAVGSLFGYLYFREWYLRRQFFKFRERQQEQARQNAESLPPPLPLPGSERKPWIQVKKAEQNPAPPGL